MSRSRTRRGALAILAITALAAGSFVLATAPAGAVTTLVTNTADDGSPTSLREVLANAGDGDVIQLLNGATYVVDDCNVGALFVNSGSDITIQAQSTGFGVTNAVIQQNCSTPVIDVNDNSLELVNVTITGGRNSGDGGGIDNVADLALAQVLLTNNNTGDDGAAIDAFGDLLLIENSTIAGNCADDDGGALQSQAETLVIVNSTIANNTSGDVGAIDVDSESPDVSLGFVTLGGNTLTDTDSCEGVEPDAAAVAAEEAAEGDVDVQQITPANITIDSGTLTVFGTAIVEPVGAPNCDINTEGGATVVSLGYNFSDDSSCGFTNAAAGDRQSAGSPGLGALGDNGGPTPTRLPAATSPLVNFIPLDVCQAVLTSEGITTDQRGITRPQDVGCEIGAVEVEALVVLFTG